MASQGGAAEIFRFLAERGVLIRYFEDPQLLRLGLPANESAWQRLETSLTELSCRQIT